MSRYARITEENGIYHIVIKESKPKKLFCNEKDKEMFMEKMRESQIKYQFKVYGYCLMDTHAHFLIDSNGEKISVIMKSIGLRYVKYYNKKHKTSGSLLKERFFSELIKSDEQMLKASLYIHANARDIKGYRDKAEEYRFSSMKCYLGKKDEFKVIDTDFVLSILATTKRNNREYYAKQSYLELFKFTLTQKVNHFNELNLDIPIKIMNKNIEIILEDKTFEKPREILKRDFPIEKVVDFVEKETGILKSSFLTKDEHGVKEAKSLFVLLSGIYTRKTTRQIGDMLEYMSIEEVNILSNEGIRLILENEKYQYIIEKFYRENK
ncbi:transposase [Clostridium ihumii]|uniref:transposase n=1 Tax=Clostridium ihumii TaxID=1470356 RepID=UPI003D337122